MRATLPLSTVTALAWTLGAASLLLWLLRLGVTLRPAAATDVVQLGVAEALAFVLATQGVLSLHGGDGALSSSLGLRPAHPPLLVLGLVLGFVTHFPAEAVDALMARLSPQTAEQDLAAQALLLSASSPLRLVVVLLVVACVGPLVEELFFRGALFGALLRGRGVGAASAVSGLCFVVGHLNHRKWPALAVVALVLSHLRAVSGSVLPGLAMHVAFNAVTVLAVFAGEGRTTMPERIDLLPALLGAAATVALSLAVHHVASRAPGVRRGRAEDAQ